MPPASEFLWKKGAEKGWRRFLLLKSSHFVARPCHLPTPAFETKVLLTMCSERVVFETHPVLHFKESPLIFVLPILDLFLSKPCSEDAVVVSDNSVKLPS